MHKAILLLKDIPQGKVVTYKELARACKTSPRAVGRIMAGNEYPKEYPCYKVVASDGRLCGYSGSGGIVAKEKLLLKEGIHFLRGKVQKNQFYHFKTK